MVEKLFMWGFAAKARGISHWPAWPALQTAAEAGNQSKAVPHGGCI